MNESFDLITANMVVEHLDNPKAQLKEIHRVLKPGGLFIFHTPNIYGYKTLMAKLIPEIIKDKLLYILEGRKEDVFPAYYKFNSDRSIKKLANVIGFNVQKVKFLVTSAEFVIVPPIVVAELLWIRLLMTKHFKKFRTNLIAVLQKDFK